MWTNLVLGLIILLCVVITGCGVAKETSTPNGGPLIQNSTDDQTIVSANDKLKLESLTVQDLRQRLADGELTAVAVTQYFLDRIDALNTAGPKLNAIIQTNPDAIAIARALDQRFAESGSTGPLHGMPVVLKDNIDTKDAMETTAGSLALRGHHATSDAFLTARLRADGAVILAKANLSEWANFRSNDSSSGWSSVGGQTRNPHVLDRNTCGSSSGSAVTVAAGLAPLAVGTETDGSIVCPAGVNGIVGIKPTVGTVSRRGIIPISHTQDTAGPMAKTVMGAAILLETLVGYDERDSGARRFPTPVSFIPDTQNLDLTGIRIGVLRSFFGSGKYNEVERIFTSTIETLTELGAEIVDPVRIDSTSALRDAEYDVMKFEFKAGIAEYLSEHGNPNNLATLADLITFNNANATSVMPLFGQNVFTESEAMAGLNDPAYQTALKGSALLFRRMFNDAFSEHDLDVLIAPVNAPAWKTDWVHGDRFQLSSSSLAAITGNPSVVVPAGFISSLPVNVAFIGPAFTEPELIQVAYAFEQASKALRPPRFLPTLETEP
ncbi:MAG: amidase [Gammaproteobacteria bacterium]|nr:amidase [Gammaproteobacteria bacterium]